MTENAIERYDKFNAEVCPFELFFGDFNDQPIPSNYYNLLNYDDEGDDGNNIHGNSVDDCLMENQVVEDAIVSDNEDINNEIIIDDDDILDSEIYPLQSKMMGIEGVGNENEVR